MREIEGDKGGGKSIRLILLFRSDCTEGLDSYKEADFHLSL